MVTVFFSDKFGLQTKIFVKRYFFLLLVNIG
jgi:hypothetical protein